MHVFTWKGESPIQQQPYALVEPMRMRARLVEDFAFRTYYWMFFVILSLRTRKARYLFLIYVLI